MLQTEVNKETLDVEEIQARFALLKVKADELEKFDRQFYEATIDSDMNEEEVMNDMEVSDEYKMKYHRIKAKVDNMFNPTQVRDNISNSNIIIRDNNRENTRSVKLPKIELPRFSGELKDWLQYWSLFKNIHEDNNITTEDKFQYLIQSMVKGTRASELINSFPPTAANYEKAIESLKNRFGREDLLVEVYVRELLKLVFNRTKAAPLSSIYDKLETQL